MIFNQHSDLAGKHSFLSPSKYHWINYDEEKLADSFDNHMTAARGTRLHSFAAEAIKLGIKLPNTQQTLNMYVNDCIGYRMQVEQVLFYSFNAFGSADAIDFRDNILRIFDLKNGLTSTKETQLELYAALFCLEYKVKPATIEYDLRIYQHDEVYSFETDPERIYFMMNRYVEFDRIVQSMREV